MFQSVTTIARQAKPLLLAASMLAVCLLVGSADRAMADYAPILGEETTTRNPLIPGAPYTNQMQAAPQGQPPPIGDGPTPLPVVPGDQGTSPLPPTGSVDPTHGNIFPTRQGPGPIQPNIYVQGAGEKQTQGGQQQGVYDYGQQLTSGTQVLNNGGPANNAQPIVNEGGPRANAVGTQDTLFTHQIQPSLYTPTFVLPTVRTFCRYLVILAVVAGTVFMILAAMGMVMGNSYAGSRAIGTGAGLLMILAGYTIWKIVELNTLHLNSIGWTSQYRNGQTQQLTEKGGAPQQTPTTGGNPFGGGVANTANTGANPFGGTVNQTNGPVPNPVGATGP